MTARPPDHLTSSIHDIAIVGSDLLLQALPARPVQVSHALLAAGYALVVPASWGDELLAEHAIARVLAVDPRPRIFCACPRVRTRLLATGDELAPHLLAVVPPPVAVARYLRNAWPDQSLRITYIGSCEGATDPAIDVHLTPAVVLRQLDGRGIDPTRMPVAFHDVIPPDRRRHWSLPGGCPSPDALREHCAGRELRVVGRDALAQEVVEGLLSGDPVVLDLADAVECACAGTVSLHGVNSTRDAVCALEPPRAQGPILEPDVRVELEYRHRLVLARGALTSSTSTSPSPMREPDGDLAPDVAAVEASRPSETLPPVPSRRHMAITPPGVATMASREGRQPAPHTFAYTAPPRGSQAPSPSEASVGTSDVMPAPQSLPVTPAPPLHRVARTRRSVRVVRDGGPSVPRAFAAMRRSQESLAAVEPVAHVEGVAAPEAGPAPLEGSTTPVETPTMPATSGVDAVADVPASDVPAVEVPAPDVPAVDVPAADPPAVDVPATDVPAVEEPVVADTPASIAPEMPTLVGARARAGPARRTPILPPSPPQTGRLWGLLATVILLIALTLLLVAIMGL